MKTVRFGSTTFVSHIFTQRTNGNIVIHSETGPRRVVAALLGLPMLGSGIYVIWLTVFKDQNLSYAINAALCYIPALVLGGALLFQAISGRGDMSGGQVTIDRETGLIKIERAHQKTQVISASLVTGLRVVFPGAGAAALSMKLADGRAILLTASVISLNPGQHRMLAIRPALDMLADAIPALHQARAQTKTRSLVQSEMLVLASHPAFASPIPADPLPSRPNTIDTVASAAELVLAAFSNLIAEGSVVVQRMGLPAFPYDSSCEYSFRPGDHATAAQKESLEHQIASIVSQKPGIKAYVLMRIIIPRTMKNPARWLIARVKKQAAGVSPYRHRAIFVTQPGQPRSNINTDIQAFVRDITRELINGIESRVDNDVVV